MEQQRRLGPPDLLYEIGRQVQKTALVMRAHVLSPHQQLCACGRIPVRLLPVFGLRCEIACRDWDVTAYTMRKLLDAAGERATDADRAVGRAAVATPDAERGAWLWRRPPGGSDS